jgi:hypothetical protein
MTLCDQMHDDATGETRCIAVGVSDYGKWLESQGYYYAGHDRGSYAYKKRASAPLMQSELQDDFFAHLAETHEPVYTEQDW